MREIKFRGQRVDNAKLVEGDLIHGVNHKKGKVFILPVVGGVMALGHGLDPLDGYEVNPETVGQFTGLKDKNGKEIYEGDVYKVPEHYPASGGKWTEQIAKVVYENGCFRLRSNKGFVAAISSFSDLIERIGNIYENPELIEQ